MVFKAEHPCTSSVRGEQSASVLARVAHFSVQDLGSRVCLWAVVSALAGVASFAPPYGEFLSPFATPLALSLANYTHVLSAHREKSVCFTSCCYTIGGLRVHRLSFFIVNWHPGFEVEEDHPWSPSC